MSKKYDIINRRFGRLVVLGRYGTSDHGDILWRCLCDCGNTKNAAYSQIVSSKIRSCGCLYKEYLNKKTRKNSKSKLLGKRFGRLVVIEETDEKTNQGNYKWVCICDCGKKVMVSGGALTRGSMKSCGCINKERLTGGGTEHPSYRGDIIKNNISLYSTYAHQLMPYKRVRKVDNNLLEVKCTYCGLWFKPTRNSVKNRLKSINNIDAENRLYCSNSCKKACPTFGQQKYPKGFKPATSREVQPELSG